MGFLETSNFIFRNQHGMRKTRSCDVSQFAFFVHDIFTSAEKKKQVDVIFSDFRKAFDKVHHQKLSYKLKVAGINVEVINWIENFLSDRGSE